MRRPKRPVALVLVLAAALSLCGCMSVTAEELYQLPKVGDDYFRLQSAIDEVLALGAEYSAPTSGTNRQSVQLQDLNGDGTPEALAFMNFSGNDGGKALRLYIFRQEGEAYQVASVIEGDGASFDRVSYTDMDGDGSMELIIGCKMGAALQLLNIYSVKNYQPTEIYSTDYTQYSVKDMNGDGNDDLVALRLSSADMPGEAELISMTGDGEMVTSTAVLSAGIESIARVVVGQLNSGTTALFVDSVYDGSGLVTDILVCGNTIMNITLSPDTGVSTDNIRSYNVYCRDVDGDGVTDVPRPRVLWSQTDTVYRVIDWFTYSKYGGETFSATTYHNFSDSWYLILPRNWGDNLTVRREDRVSGERTMVFSYVSNDREKTVDFLSIYVLTGDNKEDRAKIGDRFVLRRLGNTIYAAELYNATTSPLKLEKSDVLSGFNLIYSDWKTS
ncbi:MAG: VCBS repeat-containing protein [Oscillospiraceae bacterium]|nr:VCBS repeat-containing protein [Oscillospiraceae bacterium]